MWTICSAKNIRARSYSRGLGEQGQERLLASSAVIVGCGAIGAAAASLLVRAGVGRLRMIDRDFVEPSNLQRQTLFDEADARDALPKAVAAERKLRAINSTALPWKASSRMLNPLNARGVACGLRRNPRRHRQF